MKSCLLIAVALSCCAALVLADYYGASYSPIAVPYYPSGGSSNTALFALIGLMFLLLVLFNSNQNNTNIINLTATSG